MMAGENKRAPEGQMWLCTACGRKSKDRYGDEALERGWDESCMLNAVLVYDQPIDGLWKIVEGTDDRDGRGREAKRQPGRHGR